MPRISLDKQGNLIARILHTNPLITPEDVPIFPDITSEEVTAGIVHKDVTDAEYWALFDARISAEQNGRPYTLKRAAEYPPMADYLDGIVKGDTAQVQKYIADCLAVKAKYPKV